MGSEDADQARQRWAMTSGKHIRRESPLVEIVPYVGDWWLGCEAGTLTCQTTCVMRRDKNLKALCYHIFVRSRKSSWPDFSHSFDPMGTGNNGSTPKCMQKINGPCLFLNYLIMDKGFSSLKLDPSDFWLNSWSLNRIDTQHMVLPGFWLNFAPTQSRTPPTNDPFSIETGISCWEVDKQFQDYLDN